MLRSGLCVLAFALGRSAFAAESPPPRSEWKVPPLEGELSGEFNPMFLGGAPKVNWKLTVRTAKPLERTVEFLIEGLGLRLRGTARVDPLGEGTWRVDDAEINLADWFGWLAPHVTPQLAGASMAGMVELKGSGTWRHGVLGGRAALSIRDGRYDDPTHKVLLEGISVDFDVIDLAKPETGPEQVFTFRSGHYDVVQLGVGRIEFSLEGDQLHVKKAAIDVFGGELSIGSVEMSTKRPEFSAMAQMTGVDVGKILFLLPPVLAKATGQLDGQVSLKRDEQGVQIGAGNLALREGETANLQLVPTPGLITSTLPPRVNELYPGLKQMEMGQMPVLAEKFELAFMPQGDAEGRTALIHLVGRPDDRGVTGPLDLTVNIHGPLDDLLNFGATSALRLSALQRK